jgi:excisionase family DNA binding protein
LTHYLTVKEVATVTSMTVKAIRLAIARGDLQAVRPRGQRRLLIPKTAIDAWMEPVTAAPTAAPTAPHGVAPAASREVGSRDRLKAIEGSC